MNDRIRQAGRFIQGAAQQTFRDRDDDMQRKGFTSAAGISLRRIQEKLDLFKEQMKGPGLTKAEQMVYTQLDELKSEIEADFDRYWRRSGVDWRPPKPVAKGVIKQPGSPQ